LADGNLGLGSVAAERILGITFDQMLAPGVCKVVGEDGSPLPGAEAPFSTRNSGEAIVTIDRPGGSPLWLRTRARHMGPNGSPPLAVAVVS
jgi:hypothetical protein